MFRLNELHPAPGCTRDSKRRGRGIGSGNGKTAGRGHKGAGARSGTKKKLYFEGGQTPLTRRIPKRGFAGPEGKKFQIVNIGDIVSMEPADKEVTAEWLFDNGLIRSKTDPVKILGNGDCAKSVTVKAQAFSKSAREKIEKAKGKAEVVASA
ncbi:MAG TPA: 50S ribosomal protein L15 [Chitinivibrionales bacterium]|nr:50S ribosomal protein L15 [Chitinivibrionales bacterium]